MTFEKVHHWVRLVGEDRYRSEAGANRLENEGLRLGRDFVAVVDRHLGQTAYMDENPVAMRELGLADAVMMTVPGELKDGVTGRRYRTGLRRKVPMRDFGTSS
jgi:hypothetical protein